MIHPKGSLTPEQIARIRAAQRAVEDAQSELAKTGRAILEEGASIRELAAAAGASPTTVQRWKRGE